MRKFQAPTPEFNICLNRNAIDANNGFMRDFHIPAMVNYYIKVQDPSLRRIRNVKYEGIDLVCKHNNFQTWQSVTPIFNLGYLESRTIGEVPPRKTDIEDGYVEHIGTFATTAYREDKEVKLTRVNYIVHSHHNGIVTDYIVVDTYVEGDIKPPMCEFVSKMI